MTLLVHIRIFPAVVVAFLVASFVCSATLAAEPKRVMLLHSVGRDFKPWSEYAKAIRTELDRELPWPLEIIEQSLLTARSGDENPEPPFVEYLRALSAKRPLDLIVCIGAPAARFVQRHRRQLFATTPMIFTAVEQRRVQRSMLTENDTVVALAHDLPVVIENILHVLPDTKTVAVVSGNSPGELLWEEDLRKEFAPFGGRISFIWYSDRSFPDILKHAAALPPHSAIFWHQMNVDAAGVVHEGDKALPTLYAVANAPIFTYDGAYFGREIVGGPMHSVHNLSRLAVDVAIRILRGEKAGDINVSPSRFAPPIYDWRLMQRWGINESRLPPGSEIHFRDPTVWEQYRTAILTVIAALLLQAMLITWLIYERWWRHAAEADSHELINELARMNRFATAGELSASIAHELRQPLAAIATFGSTGLIWLKKQVPDLDEVRNVLQKMIKESHRADDVIKGVRAMFRHESPAQTKVNLNELVQQVITITARTIDSNDIVLDVSLADSAPFVKGDPVQLQQVILNLVMNAVEAMSHAGHSPRILRLRTELDPAAVVLVRVIDSGPGVDPKVAEKMFQPFFTTKPGGMGMGLSICRTIIEAHGGSLTASPSNPHGMEFQIVLPHCRYP